MLIEKFYVIKTGRSETDNNKIDWYEDIEIEEGEHGYKNYQVIPYEYPIFTSFEEAEAACKGDWEGYLFEYCDYFAKIMEYTYHHYSGYYLSHEWFYSHEEAIRQKVDSKYVYEFVSEKEYPLPKGISE